MNFRVVWLSGIVVGTGVATACDAPDPGEITFSERQTDPGGGGGASGGSSGGSSGGGATDGGSNGGTIDGGGGTDPVFGNTTYTANSPDKNANSVMNHAGQTPLEGKNCFQTGGCHQENAKKWGFAGTVYNAINGGGTVKNAEVRIANSDGTPFASVYTDDNGNFWYAGAKPPAKGRAGVRDATKTKVMTGEIAGDSGGQCNSSMCHGLTAMRLYLQ